MSPKTYVGHVYFVCVMEIQVTENSTKSFFISNADVFRAEGIEKNVGLIGISKGASMSLWHLEGGSMSLWHL